MLGLGLLAACGVDDGARGHTLAFHPCISWQTHELARCGSLSVPEDRTKPEGRRIALRAMVLPARSSVVEPEPLVFLNGGPGLSAADYAAYASSALDELRDTHDILLVDMRGTGSSSPLACNLYDDDGHLAPFLAPMFPTDRVRECLGRLRRTADLTQYTTTAAAADLEDVRAAIGAAQLNLFGASYGTRLALEYMRRYPARVRRAALLSPVPPSRPIGADASRGADSAMAAAVGACAMDAACRAGAPTPRADLDSALARLERAPTVVSLWNWRRLEHEDVRLTRRAVAELLWVASYSPDALRRALPLVHRAVDGDFRPLARQLLGGARRRRVGRAEGLMLSVLCSEDAPRLTGLSSNERSHTLGMPLVPELLAACQIWPRADVAPDFGTPVVSNVPTLLLGGGLDPITPPDLVDSTASTLSRAERYVTPQNGHAVLDDASRRRLAAFFSCGGRCEP
jgi:pimeloyl-ACP methyl ester carboxylesterase